MEGIPRDKRGEAKDALASFFISSIQGFTASSNSPVKGKGKYKSLSKDYKKIKKAAGKGSDPNLTFDGDMLGSLEARVKGNQMSIGIFKGTEDKLKSFNHNTGDTLPARPFLPDDAKDEDFKDNIKKEAFKLMEEFKE
jgi:hypothetical protein